MTAGKQIDAGIHLHAGIAEHGKLCALRGDHVNALRHYREAIALAVRQRSPEVMFRHYLECSLESLEHMGAYAELIDYCQRAIEHYRLNPPQHSLAQLDLASVHQRQGVVLVKRGERAQAKQQLARACDIAKGASARLTLAETLLRWLQGELTISTERLLAEQAHHRYFSVREETVDRTRAVPLPPLGAELLHRSLDRREVSDDAR